MSLKKAVGNLCAGRVQQVRVLTFFFLLCLSGISLLASANAALIEFEAPAVSHWSDSLDAAAAAGAAFEDDFGLDGLASNTLGSLLLRSENGVDFAQVAVPDAGLIGFNDALAFSAAILYPTDLSVIDPSADFSDYSAQALAALEVVDFRLPPFILEPADIPESFAETLVLAPMSGVAFVVLGGMVSVFAVFLITHRQGSSHADKS